jgi:hypothetical protein
MSKQDLAINFNVIGEDALRQELQKAQIYINALNAQIETLQTLVEKYIADHP